MTDYNGAFQTYPDKTSSKVFYRAEDTYTVTVSVASGQVLKKRSFLETNSAGKAIAHSGAGEKTLVTFAALTTGQTFIAAGLTWTAHTTGTTQAQLKAAWSNIPAGTGYAAANTLNGCSNTVTGGAFTAGTLTDYKTKFSSTANSVLFVSTLPNATATDITNSGTSTGETIVITEPNNPQKKIAGVLLFDVDASGGDVDATAYTEASFWADALVWAANPSTDPITLPDGTTKTCTEYDTGCAGTSASAILLQKKFVEGTKFSPLGFHKLGEIM